MTAAVIAVDGGNSKTDVALVAPDGSLLAAVRGPTVSHQAIGFDRAMAELGRLVGEAAREGRTRGRTPLAELACTAWRGPTSDGRPAARARHRAAVRGTDVVLNDTFAALRAGAEKGWGVVLICGQGINGAGIAPDGRTARFAGIGGLSGDWGGGGGLGSEALGRRHPGAATGEGRRRASSGPSPTTSGSARPSTLMRAMYDERVPDDAGASWHQPSSATPRPVTRSHGPSSTGSPTSSR